MKESNKKVLFFIKVPPPVTGATIMNVTLCESNVIYDLLNIKILGISYKTSVEKISGFSLKKIRIIITTCISLIKSLLKFKPELVYFQISPFGLAFYRDCFYIFLIKLFKIPIIYHIHGKGIQKYIGNSKIKRATYIWAFRNSYIICLAESLIFDIKDVYNSRPYIVNNAIPVIVPITGLDKTNCKIKILFFSNIMQSKGIYDFLDSILFYTQHCPDSQINAIVAGKEADISKTRLEEEIRKRNLSDKVTYVGEKYGSEKWQLLFNSHLFVFPTFHYNEAFPVVLIEAMQAGLPIITTCEGAIPEIVDNCITGFIVEKHHPEQIFEKLVILINNPELRKAMGEAGRKKFLENYTFEIFEKNMLHVFNDVIKKLK